MSNQYTIQDLVKLTALKEPFLRRCIRECKSSFEGTFIRGDNNSMLFDDNGLILFDRVKQWKESGHNLMDIKKLLENDLEAGSFVQEDESEVRSEVDPGLMDTMMRELRSSHTEVVQTKQEVLDAKEDLIRSLKQQMYLLTDGRTPDEIKKVKEIEERDKKTFQDKRLRQVSIIGELKALEGRMFASKRRMELLKELELLC